MGDLSSVKQKIISSLEKLYLTDNCLFNRNNGRGLAERCIVFRFAHYLQTKFPNYFVDCDFNSSFSHQNQQSGKPIQNLDGTITNRFVDIIVHKRNFSSGSGINSDFICFEIKKWNNKTSANITKDRNNLRYLTTQYGYKYGFHIILGNTLQNTIIEIFFNNGTNQNFTWEEFRNSLTI